MNQLKNLNFIQTIDTRDLTKKVDYSTINEEIETKIPAHDIQITTHEFNKLKQENFAKRLKQASLASINDIADFEKRQILMKN